MSEPLSQPQPPVSSTSDLRPSASNKYDVPLIPGYEECVRKDGKVYYLDRYTNTTNWSLPCTRVTNPFPIPPLPEGWNERWDEFGRVYFEDASGQKQWAHPAQGSGYGDGGEEGPELKVAKELGFHPPSRWRSRITLDVADDGSGVLSPSQTPSPSSTSLGGRPYYIDIVTDTVTWHEPIAPGYERMTDGSGRSYYVDHYLKSTQWEAPSFSSDVTNPFPLPPLPDGWVLVPDEYGRVCFVEKGTGRKMWAHPGEDANNEQILKISMKLGFHPPENWRSRVTVNLYEDLTTAIFGSDPNPRKTTFRSATMKSLAGRPYYINIGDNSVTWSPPLATNTPSQPPSPSLHSNENLPPYAYTDASRALDAHAQSHHVDGSPLPPGYERRALRGKELFYYADHYTRTTMWELPPTEAVTNPFPLPPLPDGWVEKWDSFGRVYFQEGESGRKQWTHPSPGAGYGDGGGEDESALKVASDLALYPPGHWRSRMTSPANGKGPRFARLSVTRSSQTRPVGRPYYINVITDTVTWHYPIAPGFERKTTPEGKVYYHDHYTKSSHWETPTSVDVTDPFPLPPLPDGWNTVCDVYGRVSFVEIASGNCQWTHPGMDENDEQVVEVARKLGFEPPEQWRSRLTIGLDNGGKDIEASVFGSEKGKGTYNFSNSKPLAGRPYYINIADDSVTWSPPVQATT